MISANELLERFSNLLVSCWAQLEFLSEHDTTESLRVDWLQANWELIVEGLLCDESSVVLEPYGDGADCNGESSRVLFPDRRPTHRLVCKPLNGDIVFDVLNDKPLDASKDDIVFDRFVCIRDDGWYYEAPPFDKVMATYGGQDVVVALDSIDVQLKPIV